jgi:serine/threonine protein phosphatase 1
MLNAFLIQPSMLEEWREYGGLGTLLSYGLKPSYQPRVGEEEALLQALRSAIPPSHRQFLDGLLLCYSCGDFYFVHAGVRPGRPLANQNEADLLWIRNDFLLHEEPFEKMIVHGHTPIAVPEIRSNRINIDTGAYATGTLSCLVIDGAQTQFL